MEIKQARSTRNFFYLYARTLIRASINFRNSARSPISLLVRKQGRRMVNKGRSVGVGMQELQGGRKEGTPWREGRGGGRRRWQA